MRNIANTAIERTPSQPPKITPLAKGTVRPLFSVMIPTYNCSQYLVKTLRSVLAQDLGESLMQIEVIDDHSSDTDVETLVRAIGDGRIKYFRQPKNVGSLRNFETCINRAQGEYVHILHGDDMVHEGFYEEIKSLFDKFPTVGAAFTDFVYIDDNDVYLKRDEKLLCEPGILKDWNLFIAQKQRIQPPAIVVKRSVYEHLGSFYAVHYGEDWEMWNRIANSYEVAHSPLAYASYRTHNSNISTHSLLTGKNIKDIKKVIDIIQTYLPLEKRKEISLEAKKNFALYYSNVAHRLYHDFNDQKAALIQATESLKLSVNATTLKLALKLYLKVFFNYNKIAALVTPQPTHNSRELQAMLQRLAT